MRKPKKIYCGQPGTSNTTLATVPAGRTWIIAEYWIANTNAEAKKISLHAVPSGGSPGASNILLPDITVQAKTAMRITGGGTVLEAGEFLSALQETEEAITMRISGWEE